MAQIFATRSAVVTIGHSVVSVKRGQAFESDAPVVAAFPELFEQPVEEATAKPGDKRTRR